MNQNNEKKKQELHMTYFKKGAISNTLEGS